MASEDLVGGADIKGWAFEIVPAPTTSGLRDCRDPQSL